MRAQVSVNQASIIHQATYHQLPNLHKLPRQR